MADRSPLAKPQALTNGELIGWRQFTAELLDRILEARAAGRPVDVNIEPLATFPKFLGNTQVGLPGRMLFQVVI